MYSSTGISDDSGALFHSDHNPRASYRREFEEMENRIRRCERQRAELERQFEDLMRERADCEKAAVRAMKQRQRRQMEAERQRAERNESILRMLNKIDLQAASLAAKTDRLKMLKTQYEMYLMRTWSTASQALPAYSVPMITAPPATLSKPLPQSPPKSEFVQYLTDLTHQQTVSSNSIPPPTALSNYLASQQKPFALTPSQGAPVERPYSRAFHSNADLQTDNSMMNYGASPTPMASTRASKFEMSNEDFIRYIDSEVLKEPIPKVSVVAPSPVLEVAEVKQTTGAYLEDATMSEDEPVGELSNKLKEFSVMVDAENKKDAGSNSTYELIQDDTQPLEEVIKGGKKLDELLEMGVRHTNPIIPCILAGQGYNTVAQEEKDDRPFNEPYIAETFEEDRVIDVETNYKADNDNQKEKLDAQYDQNIQELHDDANAAEMNIPYAVNENELKMDEGSREWQNTVPQEEQNANHEITYEPSDGNADYLEGAHQMDENVYKPAQSEDPLYDNQQYSTSSEVIKSELTAEGNSGQQQQQPQPMQQYETRNQHWTTARQALRSKAFPGASSKPPYPETDQVEQGYTEVLNENAATADSIDVDQTVVQNSTVDPSKDPPNTEYPAYPVDSHDPYYQTEQSAEQMPTPQTTSAEQGYHNDAMGQPVEYQQHDAQQSAAYQYVTNQEGQYVEGADQAQYQYQDATDPMVSSYATQEGYQADPNQQYQYDENAQYYNDQQAYDAQYYSQDPQQQQKQQQYYMDETNQQVEGQYEQSQEQQIVHPTDQYPTASESNEQTAYYPPDGQYEQSTLPNPEHMEPSPNSTAATATTAGETQLAEEQTAIEPSTVIDSTLVKDKQDKTATDASPPPPAQTTGDQKPAKKDGDPGSDVPTLSTVNDESDFDFSSQ
ncbi:uncharacterized protein LOC126557035 [Anopheles maculipalpis]|uniref:uncharacterized protein LOC126557035 n=1 Tax=Anopheles maculipalpis TaxID=1496333 RepID=UPI00215977EF|nr:uncharacterized protein LOC126557035 [Anopheles maculipalpis]